MKRPEHPEENERIGIFPSWNWLYAAVVAYTLFLILLLYWITVLSDYGIQ